MEREAHRGDVVLGRCRGDEHRARGGCPSHGRQARLHSTGRAVQVGVPRGNRRLGGGGDRRGPGGGPRRVGGDRLHGGELPAERLRQDTEAGQAERPRGGAGVQERELESGPGGGVPVAERSRWRVPTVGAIGVLACGQGAGHRTRVGQRQRRLRGEGKAQPLDQARRSSIRRRDGHPEVATCVSCTFDPFIFSLEFSISLFFFGRDFPLEFSCNLGLTRLTCTEKAPSNRSSNFCLVFLLMNRKNLIQLYQKSDNFPFSIH